MMIIDLLEGTGLQFVTVDLTFPDHLVGAVDRYQEPFFKPAAGAHPFSPQDFSWPLITPKPTDGDGGIVDANGPVPADRIFQVNAADAVQAFSEKWVPVPYTLRVGGGNSAEQNQNNWVRLWYTTVPPHDSLSWLPKTIVLCVDTKAESLLGAGDFTPFLKPNLGNPIGVSPLSNFFWNSTSLKGWVKKLGRCIRAADPRLDLYPWFSHYIALLKFFCNFDMLPQIQLNDSSGAPYNVHLFLDVGNSRSCGILAEVIPGTAPGPDSFEKVAIRNLYRPYETNSEPFPTTLAFLPSPFDSQFNPDMDWSPNFRIPSLLRTGHTARQSFDPWALTDTAISGPSTLSSPKRYLWSEDLSPASWCFAMLPTDGASSVIKGDILNKMDEKGYPSWNSRRAIPLDPRYPLSSLMTFFMLEILFHAMSQINSYEHRRRKGNMKNRRCLKSIVITTPNGMVQSEREIYKNRVQAAIDFYWDYYGLPAGDRPAIYLGDYDEATCVQLVFLYSMIKERFQGNAEDFFRYFGRVRPSVGKKANYSVRIASIDIGGGTSDLMVAEYQDTLPGAAVGLTCNPLFQEGVSVAGDEVVRKIIEDLIMPQFVAQAPTILGGETIDLDNLKALFGKAPIDSGITFRARRKQLLEDIFIPMAYRFLQHAETETDDGEVEINFSNMFQPLPPDAALKFLSDAISQEMGKPMGNVNLGFSDWQMNRSKIKKKVAATLAPVLRIFSQVISQYNCDIVVVGGRLSSLPIVRDILVAQCPVPPSRVVSLTGFDAGGWYPFDHRLGRIKDAKTTVAVGAAIGFFAERLKAIANLSLNSDRKALTTAKLFIGNLIGQTVPHTGVLFPKTPNGLQYLPVPARTFLGVRRIDSDHAQANMLYEVMPSDPNSYRLPLKVVMNQQPNDSSRLKPVNVTDDDGKKVPLDAVRLKLRTMEDEMYWLDSGCVFP